MGEVVDEAGEGEAGAVDGGFFDESIKADDWMLDTEL